MSACPRRSWTERRSAPPSSRWVAKAWRRTCGGTRGGGDGARGGAAPQRGGGEGGAEDVRGAPAGDAGPPRVALEGQEEGLPGEGGAGPAPGQGGDGPPPSQGGPPRG